MERRIEGSFPGGPSRAADPEGRARAERLHRVSEIELGLARRAVERTRIRRRNRVLAGALAALVVSGGVGVALGVSSHATAEELNEIGQAEHEARQEAQDLNRALLELWRMEDVEYERNARRR